MALYGIQQVITYIAWDTVNNTGKTGDSANHTLKWVKDGTASSPTNASSEVDSTNAKGLYKLTLTATETQAYEGTLHGVSSTTGISIIPSSLSFERLPDVAAGANGGLPTTDANNAIKVQSGAGANQINLSSGNVTVGTNSDKTGYTLSSAGIQSIFDFATSLLTTASSIGKLFVDNINAPIGSIPTANQNADALLDRTSGVESGWTLRQLLRLQLAGICGPRTLFDTNNPVVQNPAGTKNRLTGTITDVNGNGTWATDVT